MTSDQLDFAIDKHNYSATIPWNITSGKGYSKIININRGFKLIYQEVQSNETINIEYDTPIPDTMSLSALSLSGTSFSNLYDIGVELCHGKHDAYWGHVPGESCGVSVPKDMLHRKVYLSVDHSLFDESWSEENHNKGLVPILSGKSTGIFHVQKLNSNYFNILSQIIKINPSNAVDWLALESLFLTLIASEIERFNEDSRSKKKEITIRDQELYMKVSKILRTRMQEPPGLIELARLVGTNEFRLKKTFKEVSGYTVFDYLRMLRMEKAAEMLDHSDYSIMNIAQSVGFQNQSAFSSAFRKHYGMSPSEYPSKYYSFN